MNVKIMNLLCLKCVHVMFAYYVQLLYVKKMSRTRQNYFH